MTLLGLVSVAVSVTATLASGQTPAPDTFVSPAAAADALIGAIRTNNRSLFRAITGQDVDRLLGTGDPDRDAAERDSFSQASDARFEAVDGAHVLLLHLGNASEPFPAPLVKTGSGWSFDGAYGVEVAALRRIRRNELAAIELCHRYFAAQMEYAAENHGSGKPSFARRIRSTPGMKDGLYWPIDRGEGESLIGPLFAAAAFDEQQPGVPPVPYFGYYFKVLDAKDPESRGFALLAWPAEYGRSGLRSFLIDGRDHVYEKELGVDSTRDPGRMSAFQIDGGWTRVVEAAQFNRPQLEP